MRPGTHHYEPRIRLVRFLPMQFVLRYHLRARALLVPLLGFCFHSPSKGVEAWWLEMPKPVHEALVKRIAAGTPGELSAAVARLPELVKSGKVREIERFTEAADGTARPAHLKDGSFKIRKGPMADRELMIGASYGPSTKLKGARELRIRTKGDGLGADLRIVTLSPLGQAWQPTFCVVEGESARVLLERDPRAEIGSLMPAVIFEIKRTGEMPISASWFLTKEDPLLIRQVIPDKKPGPLQAGCGLEFDDTIMNDRGPANQFMNWGHSIRCGLLSKRSLGIEISWIGAPVLKRSLYRRSRTEWMLDEPSLTAKAPAAFEDLIEKSGELVAEIESRTEGEAIVCLKRIPTPLR